MKLVLFSGSHPRHLFINRELLNSFEDILVIIMQREELLPSPPKNISELDKSLFIKHFKNRDIVERKTYGNLNYEEVYKDQKKIFVKPDQLNSLHLAKEIEEFDADIAFIFGVDLILDPVISKLPINKINLHLGLSPWYKGAATLFWPFYFLQPQFAGVTFHQITKNPDEGEIIHQSTPSLKLGDTIHDVGAKCVIQAKNDLMVLMNKFKDEKNFVGKKQTTSGRVWRKKDFDVSHLRLIYDYYNDDIVDQFLNGFLSQKKPFLFSCLNKN